MHVSIPSPTSAGIRQVAGGNLLPPLHEPVLKRDLLSLPGRKRRRRVRPTWPHLRLRSPLPDVSAPRPHCPPGRFAVPPPTCLSSPQPFRTKLAPSSSRSKLVAR